ncbi:MULTISPECIES: helix-turn-helix domain-containing protein [Psychromonas]|uniref:AraC family transcriptional regulator n=1 Tax=Psychromonas TaxID=67572 RepID=UPI0004136767|nr:MULTISPECIES: helix-turn-helix domain-containing protein [Psychromonas]MBB1274200.1 AraC family transcriptional regulator [Psychromonas sp. SR45-3]
MNLIETVLIRPAEVITLPNEIQHHDHDHHQLVIALNGNSEFSIEGMQNIIIPGQGCVVTASSDHAFNGLGFAEILTLNLPTESQLDNYTAQHIQPLIHSNQYFKLDTQFQILLQLLVKEMRQAPDDILVAEACKNTIIALLQRHIKTDLSKKNRINIEVIDNFIIQHITTKISVAQLAGCVFLGESQFHLLFKQQMGMTPHQYIMQVRMNLAKQLLEDRSLTLAMIASASGFANQSSFTHTFTKFQGTSPSRYR